MNLSALDAHSQELLVAQLKEINSRLGSLSQGQDAVKDRQMYRPGDVLVRHGVGGGRWWGARVGDLRILYMFNILWVSWIFLEFRNHPMSGQLELQSKHQEKIETPSLAGGPADRPIVP